MATRGTKNWKTRPAASVGDGQDQRELLPERLSPSRTSDYKQCPAKFYFKTIKKLPTAATVDQVRGTLAHEAFEKIFDHPRGERTPDVAVTYVRPAWEELLADGKHDHLEVFGEQLVAEAEALVRNWFSIEDPNRFEPEGRELRLMAEASGVNILGILDRVDKIADAEGNERWIISDYKSAAKVPAADDRFLDERFFGMEVYALLLYKTTGQVADALRLVFVSGDGPRSVRTKRCDMALINRIEARMAALWRGMRDDARAGAWACKTGPLCNWCDFQPICPAWNSALAGAEVSDGDE